MHHIPQAGGRYPRRASAGRRPGREGQFQFNVAFHPFNPPRQLAPGQASGKSAVQGFSKAHLAGCGFITGFQHIAVFPVAPLGPIVAHRLYLKVSARRRVEDAVKQRRRIHIGSAPPVDRAVWRDQGDGTSIADGGVIAQARITVNAWVMVIRLVFHQAIPLRQRRPSVATTV